jgi:hypothetical protein
VTATQRRQLRAGSSINLLEAWTPDDLRGSLDLDLSAATTWTVSSARGFNLIDGYGLPANFDVQTKTGLDWTVWSPAPAAAVFGGAVLETGVDLLLKPYDSRQAGITGLADLALRAAVEGRLPFSDSYLGLRLRGAWSQSGAAEDYLDQIGARWLVRSAPWRFDARLDLAISDSLQPGNRFAYWFPMEQSGIRLLVQTGAWVDVTGAAAWDQAVQLGLEITLKPMLYYNVFPINLGIGANIDFAAEDPPFDPARDLSFWISFIGTKVSY